MRYILVFAAVCSYFVIIYGIQPTKNKNHTKEPKIRCGPDDIVIFQDCKICHCPRANRHAVCHRKACSERTKSNGSCPNAVLSMDDYYLCQPASSVGNFTSCKTDKDCPGVQLCCFDFCKRSHCTNPNPNPAPQLARPGKKN